MSKAGPAPAPLDLLAASLSPNSAGGNGLSITRLSEGLGTLLKRLALEPDNVSVANTVADQPAQERCARFICKNDAGSPGVIIDMPYSLFERLFVQIYGGDRAASGTDAPTVVQRRYAQRLGTRLCEWLESALPGSGQRTLTQSEVCFDCAAMASDRIAIEAPLALEFAIALSGGIAFKMHVAIAAALLAATIAQPAHRQQLHRLAHWGQQILSRTGQVPLPVRSEIAIASMHATRLLALQPGDVLPFAMPNSIPVLVGGQAFAFASMGEWQGSAALRIEALGESKTA